MARKEEQYYPDVDPETGEVMDNPAEHSETIELSSEIDTFESSVIDLSKAPALETLVNEEGVIPLRAIRVAVGAPTTTYKAREIVERPINIIKMKKLDSDYNPGSSYFMCLCEFAGGSERFIVPIGGQVAMPILNLYYQNPDLPPLQVTLHYHEGGKYEGYYTLD